MSVVKGVLGRKLGMTQIFTEDGRAVPVTVVEAGPCAITQIRTPDKDGYKAVQLSFGEVKAKQLNKPELGHLAKSGAAPTRHLVELRTDDIESYELGQVLGPDVFAAGDKIDVIGLTKGKGFAGAMKRWNFAGKPRTHGTERKHRSPGSQGAGTTPGRVFKGKKLAGRLGHERVTIMSLEVVETDTDKGLLLIKGAIPGPKGSVVMIRSAVKAKAKVEQ